MRKRLLLILVILFTLSSMTYSWIISGNSVVESVSVDYLGHEEKGNLTIAPKDLEMEIWVPNKNGKYVKADSIIMIQNLIPNESFPFRIHFKNHSRGQLSLNLYLQDVSMSTIKTTDDLSIDKTKPNKPSLLDVMAFGCTPGDGFYDDEISKIQQSVYSEFSSHYNEPQEKIDGICFDINLASGIKIPTTKGDDYVELICYFKMLSSAGNEYMHQSIKIGSFTASVL